MQIFSENKFHDARFVLKILSSDPSRFGPFLRKMIPQIDKDFKPKIPMEKIGCVYLTRGMSGVYNNQSGFIRVMLFTG